MSDSIPRLHWSSCEQVISDVGQLRTLIDAVEADARAGTPVLAALATAIGTLAIGLGGEASVLSFTPASLDPPYFASRSEPGTVWPGSLTFVYGTDETEFPADQAIPVDLAKKAVEHFFRFGALPDTVAWQEV